MAQQSERKDPPYGLSVVYSGYDFLACKPGVEVTAGGLKGVNVGLTSTVTCSTHFSPLAKDSLIS
jgi:hypothetical protein